jgi:hypothetical protein
VDIAANQIAQSSRGWNGAMTHGRLRGSPGLHQKSYSFQAVSGPGVASAVPSKTISCRTSPTLPNAP